LCIDGGRQVLAADLIKLLQLIVQVRVIRVEFFCEIDGHDALAANAAVDECVVGVTWSMQRDKALG
jgi:hypothetical protein